jgi:hypothetical protein
MDKSNHLNGNSTIIESEKSGIGIVELKGEAERLIRLINENGNESANIFPLEVFPKAVQAIIRASHENLNFPIDFIGASMLGAASVAIGNTYNLEVKKGFLVNAVLYIAIVGRPGTNKSAPLTYAFQPIADQDKKTYKTYKEQKLEYDKVANLSKPQRNQEGYDDPIKPVWSKSLIRDFTPEALAEVHNFNKRGICVYVDELAGWFKNFNRYSSGSEMEFWLSAWSSKPISIDRKGGEPVFISSPFITVIGTIQPGVLIELAKGERAFNGFIDRILFVYPDNLKKPCWSDSEISSQHIQNWENILVNLLNMPFHLDETLTPAPHILHLNPQAKRLLYDWQGKNSEEVNSEDREVIAGIYSKLDVYAPRFALILQLLHWACNEGDNQLIGIEAMQGALLLVEYFKKSAVKAYSIIQKASQSKKLHSDKPASFISNSTPLNSLPEDKQILYSSLSETFTTDTGKVIAGRLDIPERTFKAFLNNTMLFKKIRWGVYEKLI